MVESHNDIIESSTIPNPNCVNNSWPETKETKKSQEAFTERDDHTQNDPNDPGFHSLNDPICRKIHADATLKLQKTNYWPGVQMIRY